MSRDAQTIANIALTLGLLGFVLGFFAICGAISHGDHPVVGFLGTATAWATLTAAFLGTGLAIAAIWS